MKIIFPINPNPKQMTNNIAKKIIQGSAVTKAITRLGIEAIKIINIINTFEIISFILFFSIITHLL